MFVGAKCRPADRQCFSTVITRIQRPCCASILPPHAPPVLGRSLSVSQAVGQAASLAYSAPLLGKASPCLYPAAIPPHLCRGEPRQKCSGRPGCSRPRCCRLLAQRMSGSAFGGLWPPRLIALSAHNHAFASARHPLRQWEPFFLGFAHGRYPFDSALSRARWARTPEAVCAHILPVFAGGREPGVSRPLYRQSPPSLTRRCYRPPPGPRSTRFARSAPLVVCRLWAWSTRPGPPHLQRHHPLYRPGPETTNHQRQLFTHALAAVRVGAECPARGTGSDIKIYHFGQRLAPLLFCALR